MFSLFISSNKINASVPYKKRLLDIDVSIVREENSEPEVVTSHLDNGYDYARQLRYNSIPAIIMRALSYVNVPKMRLYTEGTLLNEDGIEGADGKLNLKDISEAVRIVFNGAREVRDLSRESTTGSDVLVSNFRPVYGQNGKVNKNGSH